MSASQGVNYRGSFGIFLIWPRLVEDSKTGIYQATMAKIKLWAERLDDFTIKNCFVSPIMMAKTESNTTLWCSVCISVCLGKFNMLGGKEGDKNEKREIKTTLLFSFMNERTVQ